MLLSPTPEMTRHRRLLLAALLVTAAVSTVLLYYWGRIDVTLGDTDDATRLTMVRDLLSGRGWYDQRLERMGPPQGQYMQWSRLLDGGLAAMMWVIGRFTSAAGAETATRLIWPLMWIFPAAAAALSVARGLGPRSAVFVTAILLIFDLQAYIQFLPGRVDHHSLQIAMTVIAFAAAVSRTASARSAAVAGCATAFGLAIGLEALPFHALIGASFAARLVWRREQARPVMTYGLSLAVASAMFFALQTPPWRWSLSYCDALALNLVAALVVAGLGLGLVAMMSRRAPAWLRITAILVAGAGAVAAYLGLDPACVHGPFADMDPHVRPIWFNRIQEIQPWPVMFKRERGLAMHPLVMGILALLALVGLGVSRQGRRNPRLLLAGLMMLCALGVGFEARRMHDYIYWCGMPLFGAGLALASDHWLRGKLVPTLALAIALSPGFIGVGVTRALALGQPKGTPHHRAPADRCFNTAAYTKLAKLPAGLVLADIDLGPYTLANTRHSVVDAPYHRMSTAILAAHEALQAPTAEAQARIRALGVTYVVDCPGRGSQETAGSFAVDLRTKSSPPWLQPLSVPADVLHIYRLRPTSSSGRPSSKASPE